MGLLEVTGVGAVIAAWLGVVVWIGKRARTRSRSAVGWGLVGAAAGVLGFVIGIVLFEYVVDRGAGQGVLLLGTLSPVLLMFGLMAAIGGVVKRLSATDE